MRFNLLIVLLLVGVVFAAQDYSNLVGASTTLKQPSQSFLFFASINILGIGLLGLAVAAILYVTNKTAQLLIKIFGIVGALTFILGLVGLVIYFFIPSIMDKLLGF